MLGLQSIDQVYLLVILKGYIMKFYAYECVRFYNPRRIFTPIGM